MYSELLNTGKLTAFVCVFVFLFFIGGRVGVNMSLKIRKEKCLLQKPLPADNFRRNRTKVKPNKCI